MLHGKAGYLWGSTLTLYLLHMGYIGQTARESTQGYPHFPSDYGHFTKCSTFICSKQMQWLGQTNLQLSGFDCKGDWYRYSIYWFTKQEPRWTNLKEMLQTNFCLYCFLLRSLKRPNSHNFFLNETCVPMRSYWSQFTKLEVPSPKINFHHQDLDFSLKDFLCKQKPNLLQAWPKSDIIIIIIIITTYLFSGVECETPHPTPQKMSKTKNNPYWVTHKKTQNPIPFQKFSFLIPPMSDVPSLADAIPLSCQSWSQGM